MQFNILYLNMAELSHFQPDIESLAQQLEKLLKVINHSDPSAEKIKHALYEKYKKHLSIFIIDIKQNASWPEINRFLGFVFETNSVSISLDFRETIKNKLAKDIEESFITRHRLSELTPQEKINHNQRERLKKIRKQIRNNRKNRAASLPVDDLADMLHYKHQTKTAKQNLDKLVKAFSKIEISK